MDEIHGWKGHYFSMSGVKRVFVEKKTGLDVVARSLFADLRDNLVA